MKMKLKKTLSAVIAAVMVITLMTPSVKANNEKANNGELKIASYNIAAKGGKTTEIGRLLADENIDIAGVQEVDYMNGRNNKDMLLEIAEAAGDS